MANKRIDQYTTTTPSSTDLMIFADVSNSNIVWKNTLTEITKAGMAGADTDDLPDWSTTVMMLATERTKLSGIQAGAQVNNFTSIQWQSAGALTLTQDDIPDGTTFVQTENNFADARATELQIAYSHSQNVSGNPHNTTKTMIWLSNVTNDIQLSQTANNFSILPEKSDVQFHLDDMTVLQDSSNGNIIKKVKNQTNLIWYGAYIQERWPSINYNHFVIAWSTTYRLNSLVTIAGSIYMCAVTHQSSSSFASDLSNGYRTVIWWGGWGGNTLSSGSWSPVTPWVNPWDLYVDILTGDLYYRNGTTWVWPINWWWWGGWIIYTTSAGAPVASTTGNRVTASQGIGANHVFETSQTIDPLTGDTINMNFSWWVINYYDVTENYPSTPNNISCESFPIFASPFTYAPWTEYVEAIIVYDNGVDAPITRTLAFTPDSGIQTFTFITPSTLDQVELDALATTYELNVITSWTAFFTITSFCYWNWVSVNNYQHKIHNYQGDIFNFNTVTQNYTNSTIVYDQTSNITNLWDNFFSNINVTNLNVQNITVNNTTIWVVRSDEVPTWIINGSNTAFTLANTPATGSLFVFINGIVQKLTTNYTISWTTLTFIVAPITWDTLRVKYVY